jgi:hypothetical protein
MINASIKTDRIMKILLGSLLIGSVASCWGLTTINATNKYACGANIGWIDWRGDTNGGAVIGEYVCSGQIWAANVGWINLGSGAPTNGIRYQGLAGNDFGVNHDGQGNLRGYAYGANIGWINFETNGAPKVDFKTGRLSGYAYSPNCGWISLSNAFACVQTDTIAPGVVGNNGLPVAWMLTYFGATNVNVNADPDGDGASNKQEYLADTNPTDANDNLAITACNTAPGGTLATVTWKSRPTRCYRLQKNLDLATSLWLDSGLGLVAPDGASTTRTFADINAPMRFYRVQALRPLAP